VASGTVSQKVLVDKSDSRFFLNKTITFNMNMRTARYLFLAILALSAFHCKKDLPDTKTTGELTIETPDSKVSVNIESGTTVLQAMEKLRKAGQIEFETSGTGEMTMIVSLNGQKNEGAGETKRNWLFAHNGRLSSEGVGLLKLNPGDRIRWCFISWQDRETCK
jgi:hypothetical protein